MTEDAKSNRRRSRRSSESQDGPALAPFITVGFPDVPTSEALARTILESGGDMLELGVPFSDPLADGPTVQMTSYRALQNGVTVRECLDVVRRLRAQGVESPLIFMGYYNPYLSYGPEKFLDDAASCRTRRNDRAGPAYRGGGAVRGAGRRSVAFT